MKKIAFSFILILVFLCSLSFLCSAEEYIFTTTESFPMPYSTSINVVNYNHNVYTTSSLEDIQYLIDAGVVDYCEEMSYSELFDYTTNDKYYEEQPNLSQVSAQFAWNKGVFGEKVKIAVIDSGLYNAASDFTFGNITKAKDYTSTASSEVTFCDDEIGHGSMVTGIIAAAHNTRGVAGIAPDVEIYIFKCFYLNEYGNQTAKNSDIIDAIYEAIDTYDVDIINLSSGTKNSTVFKEAADYCDEKGVLLVAAAGNYGAYSGDAASTLYYPASYDNVIGVGSIKANGHRASHSQRNDYVNIMAPGENIYSVRLGGYEKGTGTSYATPHVAAALALAKSLNPNLTKDELTDMLYLTANSMEDRYSGHGSLNIQKLLTAAVSASEDFKGYRVISSFGDTIYAYITPEDDYIPFFAKYEDGALADVHLFGAEDYEDYSFYLWKKNTLSPYSGDISDKEY